MDKNFNDQELSDIMKEIEALESDFSDEPAPSQAQAKAVKSEIEDEACEVGEELSQMSEQQSIKKTNHHDNDQVLSFERAAAPVMESTSMSLKVQGQLTLDLFFEVAGKSIGLEISESGLTIKMEGGMSFNVPLNDHHKKVG